MAPGGLINTLPPLGPQAIRLGPRGDTPFPLAESSLTLFDWGRASLFAGLSALGLGTGDEVLAPAYHHGSEIEAIARTGASVRFYAGTEDLAPDEAELERLLGPRVRALHVTHYLGFPQQAAHWRAWCDERGLALIEDAAQAWLGSDGGRPLGSFGDVSMFCLYKMAPVPNGGALVSLQPAASPPPGVAGVARAAKQAALWAAQRSASLGRLADRGRGGGEFDAAKAMELSPPAGPARVTAALLPRLDYDRIRDRRRRNYAHLLERLGALVPRPFDRLADGAVPWLFPVSVRDKAGLLAHLERAGILATDFWSAGHRLLDDDDAAPASHRRARTVALPVHQELGEAELERIVAAVRDCAAQRA